LADPEAIEEITEALAGIEVSLVAGGPPCQPFSKPIRWRRKAGIDDGVTNIDARRELWGPFIHFVERLRPRAVLLENVPDLAMNADGIILRKIVESLIRLDYSVSATTLPAHHFGVPQYRQRLFLVAFADDVNFCWPEPYIKADGSKVTLRDAISDLPVVAPGWNSTPGPYAGPTTELQTALRAGMPGNHSFEVWDHVTRAVREDDAEAFRLMDSQTRYPDLPAHLKRYDDENFTDKYNRLNWDVPSRAITAHLSRDGYWYIHPDQHRTLTIREAARIQTFPDWFRFAGFPVSAFRQIGEAVAPLVAEGLGGAVLTALAASEGRNGPFCYPCVEPEFCPTESRTLA
jgi:DNA (cytosine-5)-methyltransferase 1